MTDDVGDRIQRRILSEVREKLAETERKLETVEGQVERLAKVLTTREEETENILKTAKAALALSDQKDIKIEMLKRRVKNVSDAYNNKYSGSRVAITLEDVYKMTGEPYSKDGERC